MNVSMITSECIGCSVCVVKCPQNAIRMKKNSYGFAYPEIDYEKCNDCSICIKLCPTQATLSKNEKIGTYYGWNLDDDERISSSSGGIFSLIAYNIIRSNGLVIGAALDLTNRVLIHITSDETPIENMKRSKYLESDLRNTFFDTLGNLEKGRNVLFVGTPCQVSGLKKYLKKDYKNLITVDFVCGGVNSPRIFQDYLLYLEKKYSSKVVDVNFRPKVYGWLEHAIDIKFENKSQYTKDYLSDPFFQGFFRHLFLRESCYNCKFIDSHHSDIILADFWGYLQLNKPLSNIDIQNGVSLIVTNSLKGENLIENIERDAFIKKISTSNADYNFKRNQYGQDELSNRNYFLNLRDSLGFKGAFKKMYGKDLLKSEIRFFMKKNLKKTNNIIRGFNETNNLK